MQKYLVQLNLSCMFILSLLIKKSFHVTITITNTLQVFNTVLSLIRLKKATIEFV